MILLRRLLLALALLLAPPALAQDAAAPAAPTTAERAATLADVLRDEAARDALIAELERLAAPPEAPTEEAMAEDEPEGAISLGRRIAQATQDGAQSALATVSRVGDQLGRLPELLGQLEGERNLAVLWDALQVLALTIVTTYALFVLLRRLVRPIYRRMGERAAGVGPSRTFVLILGSTIIDALVVIAAWAAGYALALLLFGEFGRIDIRQTMYLNAFLVIELVKVAARFFLSPSTADLRLIAVSDAGARRLDRLTAAIVTILGYGQLLLIPIVNANVGYRAGEAMSLLLSLVVLVIAFVAVWGSRRPVADWLTGAAQGDRLDEDGMPSEARPGRGGLIGFLARRWHWPVLVYLTVLLVIVVTRPGGVLFPVLGASGRIVLAILLGMIVTGFITRAISRGVHLPGRVNERLPLLERRLNRFVPLMLMAVRALVVLVVAAIAADVIGLIDFEGWLESEIGAEATATLISTALIVLVGFAFWLAITSWVDYRLNPEFGHVPTARETTLLTLLRNAATIAILIITLMFALSEMGVDIAPLLASAGVLGLAIGFGAQKLVQDIITGVFIQFESAINVGDVITVSGTTGTVERLTIRSVSLRDAQGVYHIIPFSSVDMVSNYMRGFAYVVADIGVAYREDIDEVREAMLAAFEDLAADPEFAADIVEPIAWLGVTAFGDNAVTCRARIKTMPGKQWGLSRAYNAAVKRVFDARGIEMPFPHRTIYFGEDKDGSAPIARVRVEGAMPGPASG